MRVSFLLMALLATLAVLAPSAARAADPVHVLVLREHGIGSAAQAQPYLDQFVAVAAKLNGWSEAHGKYITTRKRAQTFISTKQPQYGILTLAAFLALRKPHKLTVVGVAEVARAGGRQYHLVSRDAASLDECLGETLASNHADDPRFINRVVSGGKFTLDDFTLVPSRRPIQTIKKVARGEAVCALIDDAQYNELGRVQGTSGIRSVWKSAQLPPMVVVAFPNASSGDRSKFKSNLGSICTGDRKSSCDKIGIQALKATTESTYTAVIRAYGD